MQIDPSIDEGRPPESRLAEPVHQYIMNGILEGRFKVGDQLPTERSLSEQFNCPRSVVRKALTILELEGRITRNVGRGTFVSSSIPSANKPAYDFHTGASPADLMEARMLMEPNLALLAVQHATVADIREIEICHLNACEAPNMDEFHYWDGQFHRAIARATHNSLIISAFEQINRDRLSSEWSKLKSRRHAARPERRSIVEHEHEAIVTAIKERDDELARRRMTEHLLGVRNHLFGC